MKTEHQIKKRIETCCNLHSHVKGRLANSIMKEIVALRWVLENNIEELNQEYLTTHKEVTQ